jgi:hypothetical protein
MEPSLVDRRCLLEADRPRSGLRDDAFMSAFALFRCEDLPVSYPSKVEIGGKDDGRSYEWTSPCCPADLVDASDEAVAAIPEDTLAGEQINSRDRRSELTGPPASSYNARDSGRGHPEFGALGLAGVVGCCAAATGATRPWSPANVNTIGLHVSVGTDAS